MVNVSTNKELIEKFLTRGVENIFPTKEALRKELESGRRLRVYQGFDPTGPYLHVGHAMGIRALRILQELGHEVLFLVGDFTAKAGDPDKDKTREILSDEQIQKNMSGWKHQASQLIDFEGENPVKFVRNYEWLSKLTLSDLITLMSKTTVQQMIERDMFSRRLKEQNPIGLHEFIYPLMQGYDGVCMQVDMEIGGTDQIFNMLMGRHLIKEYLGKGVDEVVKTDILEAADKLRAAGAEVIDVSLPSLPLSLACYYIIMPAEVSSNLSRYDGQRYGYSSISAKDLYESYNRSRSEGFGKEAKRRIMIGTYVLSSGYYDDYYNKAMQVRTKLIEEFDNVFQKIDFLIGPTAPTVAFEIGNKTENPLEMYLADILTVAPSLVGIPAISIPTRSSGKMPVGLQVIGASGRDKEVLNVADSIMEIVQ